MHGLGCHEPFRLAYFEAVLRAADRRAIREADKQSLNTPIVGEEAVP